jgi:hypothetical protein
MDKGPASLSPLKWPGIRTLHRGRPQFGPAVSRREKKKIESERASAAE